MSTTPLRYTDAELQEFKILIDGKLEKARKEVLFLREQIQEANENSASQQSGDWTDESSSHTEMELLNNMLGRQHLFVQNLESALRRIQNKTYGVCSVSGELIDKKRLSLVPHATKSVEAKSRNGNGSDRNSDANALNGSANGKKTWEDEDAVEEEDASSHSKSFGRD